MEGTMKTRVFAVVLAAVLILVGCGQKATPTPVSIKPSPVAPTPVITNFPWDSYESTMGLEIRTPVSTCAQDILTISNREGFNTYGDEQLGQYSYPQVTMEVDNPCKGGAVVPGAGGTFVPNAPMDFGFNLDYYQLRGQATLLENVTNRAVVTVTFNLTFYGYNQTIEEVTPGWMNSPIRQFVGPTMHYDPLSQRMRFGATTGRNALVSGTITFDDGRPAINLLYAKPQRAKLYFQGWNYQDCGMCFSTR
jgi:hypothetical protein